MECAGNGRTGFSPRAFSQPWLDEAVGTGRWRGAALRPLLEECGVLDDAVEVVFTGLDRGTENGLEQDFARSLPVAEAGRDGVILAYELNGGPLPPRARVPAALARPGLVRDDQRQVAVGHHGGRPSVRRTPAGRSRTA